MTGWIKHMCSAPLIGSLFKEKCRIITGTELNGLLNCPRMKDPSVASRWIRMCINPLALLRRKKMQKLFNPRGLAIFITLTRGSNLVLLTHCSWLENCLHEAASTRSQLPHGWWHRETSCENQIIKLRRTRCCYCAPTLVFPKVH